MHRPPQVRSFLNTWCASWLMPELVLPEPVSPVMSQPRQNSFRRQVTPLSRTTILFLGRAEISNATATTMRNAPNRNPSKSSDVNRGNNLSKRGITDGTWGNEL